VSNSFACQDTPCIPATSSVSLHVALSLSHLSGQGLHQRAAKSSPHQWEPKLAPLSQLSDDFGLCSASALVAPRRGSLGQQNSWLAAAVLQPVADQEH